MEEGGWPCLLTCPKLSNYNDGHLLSLGLLQALHSLSTTVSGSRKPPPGGCLVSWKGHITHHFRREWVTAGVLDRASLKPQPPGSLGTSVTDPRVTEAGTADNRGHVLPEQRLHPLCEGLYHPLRAPQDRFTLQIQAEPLFCKSSSKTKY